MAVAPPAAPAGSTRLPRWLMRGAWLLAPLAALDQALPPPLPGDDGGAVVLAADGRPLRAFAGRDGVWRRPVDAASVSPRYLEALLAYEDQRFHWHPGIDPLALARASWQAVRAGRPVSGGSTLTMQVARILEPPQRRRTLAAKLRQSLRALQLERRLDKSQILALYLDHAPFGGPVEGVGAASWAWLGKDPGQLSHAEAALLVVLPQAPGRNRPDRHPERARAARDKVLARMADTGIWPVEVVAEARQEPVLARRLRAPQDAALLAQRLRSQAPGTPVIQTLVDADLQAALEERVRQWLRPLPPRTSAALLVVGNDDLAVRAYVGSGAFADLDRLGHVDMVRARRSPGSTLKPFLYGLAIDDGLIHTGSLLVDAPFAFDGYRPGNFDSAFRGPVSAAQALRLSLNVPAVDLLDRVGPARFAARLRHGGLGLDLPRAATPNLAMVLGGTATSLQELVGAYRALARDGLAGRPRLRPQDPLEERRLLSPGAAGLVRSMLLVPGPAGSTGSSATGLVAKTGTSWGYRDAWAIGILPEYTLGVWIGRPDGTPQPGQFGAITALPLLESVAAALPRRAGSRWQEPAGVESVEVCWPSGQPVGADPAAPCPERHPSLLLEGLRPPPLPDRLAPGAGAELTVLLDADGRRRRPDCAGGQILSVLRLPRWPLLAQPWLDPQRQRAARPPPWAGACGPAPHLAVGTLRLAGVVDGATLKPAPGGDGSVNLRLVADGGEGRLWWLLDDRLVAEHPGGLPLDLRLAPPGRHRLVVLDAAGRYASARFRVIE
ncbi:MAG: penicillin-binding protein 1C [Xanthomonadales bacterium]|nr:penicillin-binding protein 1C [Xanthomonadales bacterium]